MISINWKVPLLLLLCIIPFAAYIFLAPPWLNNPDTYYFYFASCGNPTPTFVNESFLTQLVFTHLPCNILFYKLIGLPFLIASVFTIYAIAKEIYPRYAFFAPLSMFITPVWFLLFTKFENDHIGIVLALIGVYFWVKSWKSSSVVNIIMSLSFFIVAGLFWGGAYYLLFPVALTSLPHLALAILPLVFGVITPMGVVAPLFDFLNFSEVNEAFPIVGFAALFFLLLGLFAMHTKLKWATVLTTVYSILNAKWGVLAVPFLSLNMPGFIAAKETERGAERATLIKQLVITVAVVMLTASSLVGFGWYPFPSKETMVCVQDAVKFSSVYHLPIRNDWSFGYFLKFYGYTPHDYGSNSNTLGETPHGAIVLTYTDRQCRVLESCFKNNSGNLVRIYLC